MKGRAPWRSAARLATAVLGTWLAAAPAAVAQQPATPPPPEQTDVFEWLRRLRHEDESPGTSETPKTPEDQRKRADVLFVPIIASKPSTGFTFGAGVSLEFLLGDLADTYVSSVLSGLSMSTKKYYSMSARLSLFGAGNQWTVPGDNHYQLTGQETYGFGTDTTSAEGVTARFNSIKVVDTYLHRIAREFYAGIGFQVQRQSDIQPPDDQSAGWNASPFAAYSERFGFDPAEQTAAGLSASLRHDSRDFVSDPSHGWYADVTYRAHFADFLGGDSTWQRLLVDARAYKGLGAGRRQTLALWGFGDLVTGGRAPYFVLPATGTDPQNRSGRGYAEGRFRGEHLLYGEAEYRVALRPDGLVGMVAFVNATTVGSTFDDDRLFDDVAVGAGFGFRLRLEKRSRTNICLDFGFGRDGSHGIYIALAEAF